MLEVLCLNEYWEYIYQEYCLLLHENSQHKSPIPKKKDPMSMSLLLGITFIICCFIQSLLPPACALIRVRARIVQIQESLPSFCKFFWKISEGLYHRFPFMLFV